jgi:hypothetical protein
LCVSSGDVSIARLFDRLPEAVSLTPATVWSVFARSLGEQGADGRAALAWRWALTGDCPSPVTLGMPLGRPPSRHELTAEADAAAESGRGDADPGGQLMHARFVLRWLAGELDALPLWNSGRPEDLHVTDGAAFARAAEEIDEVHYWAMLAQWRHPWPRDQSALAEARVASGSARGIVAMLEWVCGEIANGPLTGERITGFGRPSLYQVSLEVRPAMGALVSARKNGDEVMAARMEAAMDTFVWLAGWSQAVPVDRHGHLAAEECAERGADCGCAKAGICLRAACPACCNMQCVEGFGQDA